MSNLTLPRVHFLGQFTTNVGTANNGNPEENVNGTPALDAALVKVNAGGMSDADFATWLKQLDPTSGALRGGWNIFGGQDCGFTGAVVNGVQLDTPVPGAGPDPLLGAAVSLDQAVMVDLDPQGIFTTQIFCDEFQVQGANGLSVVGQPTRFYSRWVARRNLTAGGFTGLAAVWHASIPPGQLTVSGAGSPAIDRFRAAQGAGHGLFVRFCTYLLAPQISDADLASQFASGQLTENPAVGRVVGTIGTWNPGEMSTLPVGRRLAGAGRVAATPRAFTPNPAVLAVDHPRKVVALDLINAFPETDASLAKVDVGDVGLYYQPAGSAAPPERIGPVAYDRASYEAGGGMADVPYPPALDGALDSASFLLIQESTRTVLMREADATVETDDRGVYLQEGEQGSITVRVLVKGAPAAGPVSVPVLQVVTSNESFAPADPTTAVVEVADHVDVPAGGVVTVPVKGLRAGTCLVGFAEPGGAFGTGVPTYFANVRVLPADNYDSTPDAQVNFALVYQEVLRYYHLIHPKMDQFIDLSSEFKVKIRHDPIRQRVDKSLWNTSSYMPRTRDMSDGKRKLLVRWLDIVSGHPGG